MVSFDGVRYGVPWQYSGKEVRPPVRRLSGNHYGEVLLAKHKAQYRSGNGRFWGSTVVLRERIHSALFHAPTRRDGTVEVRELSVYDQSAGRCFLWLN